MKTIGFVDYYINEWHANNYPAWIKSLSEKYGLEYEVRYAWAELNEAPIYGKTTDEWCSENGIEKCDTIEELCEKSDYIMILSPSDPQKHLEYAKKVLKFGKATYIDKTFAPNRETAEEIFEVAKENNVNIFSSSALRYASELDNYNDVSAVITTGGGVTIDEYIIHQTEMIVKLFNAAPVKVKVEKQGKQYCCKVIFDNEKEAIMLFDQALPFSVCAEDDEGISKFYEIKSEYFIEFLKSVLLFFESNEIPFDYMQTINIISICDAVVKAKNTPGEWIYI